LSIARSSVDPTTILRELTRDRTRGHVVKDLIITTLKIVAPISVALIVFAQGLKISPGRVGDYFKHQPWLILRSLVAVLVLVPLAALAIILLLKPSPEVAVGLAILASCPPAPLMMKGAPKIGQGDATFMAALHLSLAALAFITVPLCLALISMPLGFQADVDLLSMAMILGRTILIPVGLGMTVCYFFPRLADAMSPKLDKVGAIGLIVVVLFAMVSFFPILLKMDPWSYLVMAAVAIAALAIGHGLGPRNPHERTTLAIESAVRHPVLAITIAASNFTPERALPVLVPCIIVFVMVGAVYLFWRRRSALTASPATH
jgi:BASS family bile acid:Na+ symporter